MIRFLRFGWVAVMATWVTGAGAQPGPVPDNQWLLADYRPTVSAQFCNYPHLVGRDSFDGTMEECLAEFEQLFDKCAYELPNVSLPAEFKDKAEQGWVITLLYDCVSSHYIGGARLEEFNRKYASESSQGSRPAE